ncbi:MAG: 3'-5' exonuclease [Sphingobacteriales bacterium]|nr:3'-5' exonuclease [Sphingobacteriales bacterium]
MILRSKIQDVLFLDIETVPLHSEYEDLNDMEKYLWDRKARYINKDEQSDSEVYARAGIYAEFGRIVCICVGKIGKDVDCEFLKLRCFYNDDERNLLLEFKAFLQKLNPSTLLCAHNGKEFDFPFICRRMLINGIELPDILNIAGKKPWELQHLDTLELWKFGDFKHFTSLELLAYIFKIDTPKDDIDGSMVHKVYYKENNLQRIVDYCYKDVVTIAQLLLRFNNQNTIRTENIYYV